MNDNARVDFISRNDGIWILWSRMFIESEEFRFNFLPEMRAAAGMPAASFRSEGNGRWCIERTDIDLYGFDDDTIIDNLKSFLVDYFKRQNRGVEFKTMSNAGTRARRW